MEEDTIALLKECNSGIKMGVSSLSDVMDHVTNSNLRSILMDARKEHEKLGDETHSILLKYHEEGKEPHPVAKAMATMKTDVMMTVKEDDRTIAGLITDGCDMGVKSLYQYLNKYEKAEQDVRDMTKKVIESEEHLRKSLQTYL